MNEVRLVGESPQIAELRRQITTLLQRAARGLRPPAVLLQGETGAGKGLIASLLHRMSVREKAPFVDVNCAAIPEALLESELFGYERGAFTGASRSKPGLFQAAHGGTLFLDEVGLLPLPLQAKLLTVLEERAVRRLGGTRKELLDIWIVSASNADLAAEVRARRFREDLYHRLALVTLWVPPLRERRDDIVLLAELFLERTRTDYGLPPLSLAPDARERLRTYDWPGNVRELANVIERAVLLGNSPRIGAAALGLVARSAERSAEVVASGPSELLALTSQEDVLRKHLRDALHASGGNISHTAKRLGITRNTVRARMRKFGLTADEMEGEEDRALEVPADDVSHRPVEGPEPPPPGRPASPLLGSVRWERRRVTVMRAVLPTPRGEDWASAGRGLQFVIDKVQGFGGWVRDLTPVSLDAVFGVDAIEEAPRRAAHAALAILKAFERGQDPELPAPRIVIHSGRALVGYIGETAHVDQQSVGTLSNTLSSFIGAASPGEVLVSTSTAAFIERRFALEPRLVAEFPSPRAYRLRGFERNGLGLWGTPSRFVGRAAEMEVLRRQSAAALGGRGQVIGIVGDPGVGKSRLIWEFRRSHTSLAWRGLEAACIFWGRTLYHLAAELLRVYFAIDPATAAGPARARIEAVLGSSGQSLAASIPALLTVLGLPHDDSSWEGLDAAEQRRRMIDSVRQLFVLESRRQPLLIVVEDAHWVDAESQAVFETLVSGLGGERILLLIAFRPGYHHPWARLPFYTEVPVRPLTQESANELLDGLLGQDEAFNALKEDLVDSTEGNPFFLEESVRALVDSGTLTGERGDYRLAQPVTRREVPPTVEDVLGTRIDRLAPDDRRLLQTAAIIGLRVRLPILRAAVNMEEGALNEALRRLQSSELLDAQGALGSAELSFNHSLTYEVAQLSVPPGMRQAIHEQVLGALEGLHHDDAGDHVDRLAYHAREGAVWDKALVYTREAGDRALRVMATLKAVEWYDQALEVLQHLPPSPESQVEGIELRLRLRHALWPLGRLPEILGHLRDAEAMATAADDTRRLGWISCYLCQYHWVMGENERALEAGGRALALAQSLGERALEAETRFYVGITYHSLGDCRRATESLSASVTALDEAAIGPADRFPSRPFALSGRAIVRGWLAWALAELGSFHEGAAWGLEAVRIAEAMASPFALVAATAGLGILHTRRGALDEALPYLDRSLELCRTYSFHNWFPAMATCLGHVYVGLGRVEEGVALLEQGLRAASRSGIVARSAFGMVQLAEGYLRAGRRAEAETAIQEALEGCRASRARGTEAWAIWLKGEMGAHAAQAHLAEAMYAEALAIAEQLELRPLIVRCHLGLGRLGGEKAEEHMHRATALARDIDMALPVPAGRL